VERHDPRHRCRRALVNNNRSRFTFDFAAHFMRYPQSARIIFAHAVRPPYFSWPRALPKLSASRFRSPRRRDIHQGGNRRHLVCATRTYILHPFISILYQPDDSPIMPLFRLPRACSYAPHGIRWNSPTNQAHDTSHNPADILSAHKSPS
jgi:hypothetical protein